MNAVLSLCCLVALSDVASGLTMPSRVVPQRQAIALVLRGGAFRPEFYGIGAPSCKVEAKHRQLHGVTSLMEHIIKPLENRDNVVDIFVGDSEPDCPLMADLIGALKGNLTDGRWRAVFRDSASSISPSRANPQALNVRHSLEFFKKQAGGIVSAHEKYQLVIVTRLDLIWKSSIFDWPTLDFHGLNFFSRCEAGAIMGEGFSETGIEFSDNMPCVNDIIHVIPGSMFAAFDAEVSTKYCFAFGCNPEDPMTCAPVCMAGHCCYRQMAERFGKEQVHFITDWRPTSSFRYDDSSGIASFN